MSVRPNRPMLLLWSDGACAAPWKERERRLGSRRALSARGIRAPNGRPVERGAGAGRDPGGRHRHGPRAAGPAAALARGRVGSVAGDKPDEESLRRRRRRFLGPRPAPKAGPWGHAAGSGGPLAADGHPLPTETRSEDKDAVAAAAAARIRTPCRRDGNPARRLAPRPDGRACGRLAGARACERRQPGRRSHVGVAGNTDRGTRDARLDRRCALARRVERERGGTLVTTGTGRLLGSAPVRPGVPRAHAATRSSGKRPGPHSPPRRGTPREAAARGGRSDRAYRRARERPGGL